MALLDRFDKDAESVFVEIIEHAGHPVQLRDVREVIVRAGADPATVNRRWKSTQKRLVEHPQIVRPDKTHYEWSPVTVTSEKALTELTGLALKSSRNWIVQPYVKAIKNVLAAVENSGPRARPDWTEQSTREKVTLLADVVAGADQLAAEDQKAPEIVAWLMREAQDNRLDVIGPVGATADFTAERHEGNARAGERVRIRRCGFIWTGTGKPIVVLKAQAEPAS